MFLAIGIICFLYHVSSGNSGYYDIETVVYYLKLIGDIILIVGGSLEIYLWKIYKQLKTDYPKYLAEHQEGKLAQRIEREEEAKKWDKSDSIALIIIASILIFWGLLIFIFTHVK